MDIRLQKIAKAYGENIVLRDFSHSFPAGRVSCILGPSGCGKTTLLRLIAALEAPDSGSISGTQGKRISMVFQEDRLLEQLSARKNVLLTARPGFTASDADLLLQSMGLPADRRPVGSYSGGMRRRTAIARALAAEYDLLLLDEPLAGLDEETKASVIQVILGQLRNRTCIWITHDEETALALGGNILRM